MKYLQFFLIAILILLFSCTNKINETPNVIELIDMDYRFSTDKLLKFCSENEIDNKSVYQWQNHWIIYTGLKETNELVSKIENQFPRLKVNVYEKPFYNFNRAKFTAEKQAKEWEHIIMTANLVQDTIMQNEYMEYHRTQFEKWPEISKGFVNANFQQLLVYRNGRQLMLVISIPKGKTLDELNPKTTENNPRVDEWNQIMAKYQEGIEDAPKGTTWVMFQKVNSFDLPGSSQN